MRLKEIWKPIKGYQDYEVSDLGNVRSLKYGKVKLLKPGISRGYYHVNLWKNGKVKNLLVHRLVVETFIGKIPKGQVVNHINEDKSDNRLSNLEIVTQKENQNHGTRNERIAKANSKALIGNTNSAKQLKLTNAKTCGKYTFSNSYEASEFFGYLCKTQIGTYISSARKRGENFIKIFGEKHYFVQESDKYILV